MAVRPMLMIGSEKLSLKSEMVYLDEDAVGELASDRIVDYAIIMRSEWEKLR